MTQTKTTPLADQLRPSTFSEMVGQDHLLGEKGWITKTVASRRPLSILLWGPPGSGKTTLARLYAAAFDARLLKFSAVFHGTSDLKKAIQEQENHPLLRRPLIVFIDEIHRFNKAQQDTLLPFVENGTITLVGATTENPSFSLNNALLSRVRTLVLHPLSHENLETLLERAPSLPPLTPEAKDALIQFAAGDGRHLLNMVENLSLAPQDQQLGVAELEQWVQKRPALYDKGDDGHYNLISALHKAVRGSDPDSSLYWLARMLEGGEDPHFLGRRLVRMATEDVGLADPDALTITLNAWKAYSQLGSPEGELALAEAVIYLALAPKSNGVYAAFKKAQALAKQTHHLSPPKTILNAPTKLMKNEGYGEGYLYDHDLPDAFSGQSYFPEGVERPTFYQPVERGFEREMRKRVLYFNELRRKKTPPRA